MRKNILWFMAFLALCLASALAIVPAFGSPAWSFTANISPNCNTKNNNKSVAWSFSNLESDTASNSMDITVQLSGQSDQAHGDLHGGSSTNGSFDLGSGAVPGGTVYFQMAWHNHSGTDSTSRSFVTIPDCFKDSTPTEMPSATPTGTTASSATPTQKPSATNTANPSQTETSTPTSTSVASNTPTVTAQPSNTPTATQFASPTSTPAVSRTPTSTEPSQTPTSTAGSPPTDHPFTPPTGNDNCFSATITNNSNVGISVILRLDGDEEWRGDLGVFQTLTVAWKGAVATGVGTLDWTDNHGRSGSIGLGSFGPCIVPTQNPTPPVQVKSEGSDADFYVRPIGNIRYPALDLNIPIGLGSVWGDGTFHHALRIAGEISLNSFGIHQSLAPNLELSRIGDLVLINDVAYHVVRVIIVPSKDPLAMETLLSGWTTITTCTPDGWRDNLVILLERNQEFGR